VDATSVLSAHLTEVIKHNAHELLSRNETKRLIDRLNDSYPKLAEELIPKLLSLGEVHKVLQQLLREQVSIRDLGTILETLIDAALINKNPIALVEAVRRTQGRALIQPLLDDKGELKIVTLDTAIEDECQRGSNLPQNQTVSTPQQVAMARRVLEGLSHDFGNGINKAPPVLLCSSPGRYYLRRLLEPFIPKIVVISPGEIPPLTRVQSVGVVH
jgi:flagellar biosynthesis protein FlhA